MFPMPPRPYERGRSRSREYGILAAGYVLQAAIPGRIGIFRTAEMKSSGKLAENDLLFRTGENSPCGSMGSGRDNRQRPIVRESLTEPEWTEYKERATALYSVVFRDDPVIVFLLSSMSAAQRVAYTAQYMGVLMKAAWLNAATFEEADGWKCAAVWMPPGARVDNPLTIVQAGFVGCVLKMGPGGAKRMLLDFQSQSDACKKKALKGRKKYNYLFFIGTDPDSRGRGYARNLIRAHQKPSPDGETLPIWLESTTEHSRDIYASCGFAVVGEYVLGKGRHAASGHREKGGPGVPVYAMLWEPEGSTTK
nr:putative n-acetyltransferase [Quercus suber]